MKTMAPVHRFRIRLKNRQGVVLAEEPPLEMTIGDSLSYGSAIWSILIDGKPAGDFEAAVEFTWLPPDIPLPLVERETK